MTDEIIEEIRSVSENLSRAILRGITLDRAGRTVTASIITDEEVFSGDRI